MAVASKYGEDNLVQGSGRFGGSMLGSGNIKASNSMPSMSEAEFNSAVKSAEAAGKTKSIPYQGKPSSTSSNKTSNLTNPETMSSGANRTSMKKDIDFTEYKKGGSVSSRADGCAQRGKTKGRII